MTSEKQAYPVDSLGAVDDLLFEELAEEAKHYISLLKGLKQTPLGTPERERLETELYGSLSHLQGHSKMTLETLDAAVDALPEDEAGVTQAIGG